MTPQKNQVIQFFCKNNNQVDTPNPCDRQQSERSSFSSVTTDCRTLISFGSSCWVSNTLLRFSDCRKPRAVHAKITDLDSKPSRVLQNDSTHMQSFFSNLETWHFGKFNFQHCQRFQKFVKLYSLFTTYATCHHRVRQKHGLIWNTITLLIFGADTF